MRDEPLTGQEIFTRAWRMRRVVLGDEALARAEGEYDADDAYAMLRAGFFMALAGVHYAAANVRASHTEPDKPTREPATGPTFDDAIEMLKGSGSGAFSSAASYLRQRAGERSTWPGDTEYVGKRCVGCNARAGEDHAEKCPAYLRLMERVRVQSTQADSRGCTCGAAMGVEHDKTCPSWFDATTPFGRGHLRLVCTCNAVPGTTHSETCPVGQAALARGPMFPAQWCTACGLSVEVPAAEHREGCSYHGTSKTEARKLRPVRDNPQG